MSESFIDYNGDIHIVDDDGDYRQAAPRPRHQDGGPSAGRRRRRRRRIIVHQPAPSTPYPTPYQGPPIAYYPPAPQPRLTGGLDLGTALEAVGALLPVTGQLIAAFRPAPDRPALTGNPDRDLPSILEYVAENFDHARTGAQTAGVLGTAGAIMEILASLQE